MINTVINVKIVLIIMLMDQISKNKMAIIDKADNHFLVFYTKK
ncbi:hypothetical protein B4168_2803 [Anoxybacillus flavithermus]|nr:hypothetical protein B4168_2803 [Anoxybacillus flavithermus]OAO84860.1 hypothetical protein GT23_3246 [Parageobacillus thermoglucosidasius]